MNARRRDPHTFDNGDIVFAQRADKSDKKGEESTS